MRLTISATASRACVFVISEQRPRTLLFLMPSSYHKPFQRPRCFTTPPGIDSSCALSFRLGDTSSFVLLNPDHQAFAPHQHPPSHTHIGDRRPSARPEQP